MTRLVTAVLATTAILTTAIVAAACNAPPSVQTLPAAIELGTEVGGIDGVAAGEFGVVWTTTAGGAGSNAGRVWRWRRANGATELVAAERPEPRLPLVGHDRIYWQERDTDHALLIVSCAHTATEPRPLVRLDVDKAILGTDPAPLLEASDLLVVSTSTPLPASLARVAGDGSGGAVALGTLPFDAEPFMHASDSVAAFTGLVGHRPEVVTLTVDELTTGDAPMPAPVDLQPLRVVEGLWVADDAYIWLDPGEPGLRAAVRRRAFSGGQARVLANIPAGAAQLVFAPYTNEAWLRAPHALLRVRGDGTTMRYVVPYDPLSIVADLDGLVVLAAAASGGGTTPVRVLLQPWPIDQPEP